MRGIASDWVVTRATCDHQVDNPPHDDKGFEVGSASSAGLV
ncbi:hypothetical protein HMPREF9621_02199 [Cutibacterium modestum HL037PA2]|nr:hypothetical protein HMPREF9621_02199 [Cutibacterium modestum HL037PA2]